MRSLPMLLALVVLPFAAPSAALHPPVTPTVLVAGFRAPTDRYGAGHRGMDLQAEPGMPVRSPMDGVVTFAGPVAGKDVVTITDGRRIASMEPVRVALPVGSVVHAGEPIGNVGHGGHCSLRCVHLGLRVGGNYVPPLALRARLLP